MSATGNATITGSGTTSTTITPSTSTSTTTTTHIFRSLSSESQKRDWSKRLSLRGMRHGAGQSASKEEPGVGAAGAGIAAGAGGKHRKFFSRSASLKQAGSSSRQASMELHVPGHSSAAGSPSGQPQLLTQPSTPKKSNWEVIEHFNTSAKGGKAMVSSSLIAVSIH
ncbi:GH15583 [Drosophila grimshawi]|uniref:GH15583 n=1 Tax=Drosophila grimshawi TaxID=7222 RepID=B4J0W4_DROGR|nr:GH15583 [Drosophila grimshawi]